MSPSDLQGKVVVVTGTFSLPRGELEAQLLARGATIGSSVTKKTQVVFAGHKAGGKLDKARELGLTVHGEAELLAVLAGAVSAAAAPAARASVTRLGDFRERVVARIAELKAHHAIKVLYEAVGDPVAPEVVDAAAAKFGVALNAEERDLYARMNGCFLVWIPVHAAAYDKARHKPKKGRPPMKWLESLDTDAFRIIAMPPIEEVFGKPIDYARFLGEPPPRLGFDFPGNYTTPALVVREGRITVEVGDDHGADWTSTVTSLEDYVETVLATWGDVGLRRQIFLKHKHGQKRKYGVGRAHFDAHPVPLASLLPSPPPKSVAEENTLLRLLKRTFGASLSDAQLAEAAVAVGSRNADLVGAACQRLSEQPLRARAYASTLAKALTRASPNSQTVIVELIDKLGDVVLSEDERTLVLRCKGGKPAQRGRIAAALGRAAVPAIADLLRDATVEMERARAATGFDAQRALRVAEYDVMAAAHAALLLGGLATQLVPQLLAHVRPPDFEARAQCGWDATVTPSLAAAVAVVAIEPTRAEELFEHLRIFIRSDYPRCERAGVSPNATTSDFLPAMSRLPEAVASRLANEIFLGESQDDVVFPSYRMGPRLGLLGGLGRAGVDAALALLEQERPATFQWWPMHAAIFGRVLAYASLSPEDRARAIAIAKAAFVPLLASQAFDSTYLGYVCRLGGLGACAPELGRSEVLDIFLADRPTGIGLMQVQDGSLIRFLLEFLRAEGADPAKLRHAAKVTAWLGTDGN